MGRDSATIESPSVVTLTSLPLTTPGLGRILYVGIRLKNWNLPRNSEGYFQPIRVVSLDQGLLDP